VRQAQNVFLSEEPFVVVVSDYQLPDGDGLGFFDWLRREMRNRVPFVLISGAVIPSVSAVDDYGFLAKPFLMEEFQSRLEWLSCGRFQPAAACNLTAVQAAATAVYALKKDPEKGRVLPHRRFEEIVRE
jgi:DNA-binding response OmpR family regulator